MTEGYLDYHDFIMKISDEDKEARAKKYAEHGITTKDLKWEGKNNCGYATVWLQHGVPKHIAWYVWDISDANFERNLEKDLGCKLRIFNGTGGNGHYEADLEVVSGPGGNRTL